jgi:hypothetical protein
MSFLVAHKVEVLAALLAVSELLDAIPGIQASSIWKLVFNVIKSVAAPKSP